ncbi:threonine/serine exporter family protein [Defluviitalea phaphyphila]|uniref:threonine/serine exporter family protein n=1 Tax=Defluviitalea phaphyphila TaxID=1473580 RepID=UPI00073015B3|nr:threonine/serine exporter family protein [Defluviitalea phaphyphila]
MNHKMLLKFAIKAGEIMLKSGAETYRVEDTIIRILSVYNLDVVEAFVTPTGIFATIDDETIEMITFTKRIKNRSIRLDKVSLVNDLSRQFVAGKISLKDAIKKLDEIDKTPPYPSYIFIGATAFASTFSTAVFGGNIKDCIISLFIGIALGSVQTFFNKTNTSRFFIDLIGGGLIGFLAILFTNFIPSANLDQIIIGCIMPLVPGVAITNAVRDTIEGDLLSGISKGVEAFFVAVSIATGVGIILKIWFMLKQGGFL